MIPEFHVVGVQAVFRAAPQIEPDGGFSRFGQVFSGGEQIVEGAGQLSQIAENIPPEFFGGLAAAPGQPDDILAGVKPRRA